MTVDMAVRMMQFGADTQCLWASMFIRALRYLERKGAVVDLAALIAKEIVPSS